MNRGGGYTIVETMIFLAVTGVLLISAMSLMNGRQATVQFSQGVTDAQSRMQDAIGQVASGFYPNDGSFTCEARVASSPPVFTNVPSPQGTSNDCVYLGKALAFNNTSGGEGGYTVFSLAARRLNDAKHEVSSLDEALPTPIAPLAIADNRPNTTEKFIFDYGIAVTRVINPKTGARYSTILFLSTLPKFQGSTGTLASGAQRVSFAGLVGSTMTENDYQTAARLNGFGSASVDMNPPDGIVICLADEPSATSAKFKAMLTIGEGASQTAVKLDVGGYNKALCEG